MIIRTLIAFILLAPSFAPVQAQDPPSFVVRAARIMPVHADYPELIENGVIVVRSGRIVAIGSEVEAPHDLQTIDLGEVTVVPGFVDAAGGLAGAHAGNESISGAYRAVDAFDRYGEFDALLAAGITTMHLDPGRHRLVSGRGAIVKLGSFHDGRVLADEVDLAINLGPSSLNPPDLEHWLIPPAGDQPIRPSETQRPSSRMGQFLAIREALHRSGEFDSHLGAFRTAWDSGTPLRITAQRAEDLTAAIQFLKSNERRGYIVGGIEAAALADAFREQNVPLVYTIDQPFRTHDNIGLDADSPRSAIDDLASLDGVTFAISTAGDLPSSDLRLAAATTLRAGLSPQAVLAAITRTPAQILGVADRVGSLSPGMDADFVVMSGEPLATSSHVNRVYINGRLVYRSDVMRDAVVVRGGRIWIGPNDSIESGAVLIEDGTIVAVGRTVPHPPGARIIDAGQESFVAPGFIDAFGHLGLDGDRSTPQPQHSLTRLVGAAREDSLRVAREGVTTVMMAPYGLHTQGSALTAVRTSGDSRETRVVAPTAALAFSVRGLDPTVISGRFKSRIEAGKKYVEQWEKYEKDLAEWRQAKAEGKLKEVEEPKVEETEQQQQVEDPVSGTWSVKVFGGPLPQEFEAKVGLRLTGNQIEGRVTEPVAPIEHRIVGTLDGTRMSGTIELDTGGMGTPTWEAEITEPDVLKGTIQLQMFTINVEGRRTDKGAPEFKVVRSRRRTVGKDGRPLPPKIDESLEPVRAWIEKRIPALVEVSTTQEIDAVLDFIVDEQELPLVLLNAENASYEADRLREKGVGVVLPTAMIRTRDNEPYHQADDLARRGIDVAFQSDAEDGARLLPLVGLHCVERGMSADEALAAMTIEAARMYKLDDRIGSIKPGCAGDLVIFSGHPFETSSRVLRVIVNGQEVNP